MNKSAISRREFCAGAGALLASAAVSRSALARSSAANTENIHIAEIDRKRILDAAQRYLKEEPITITANSSPRSAGGKHDYFSEGDYWWPDPKNPNGPYIQRDGMSNPDNFVAHRHAMIRLSLHVPALAAAWMLTKEERYAAHAAKHLRAWFLDPATLMNPNLQYAQAIHGRFTGRGTGIIDTIHLVEVARSIPVLSTSKSLTAAEQAGLKKWFSDYLQWMTTSKNGQDERDAKNNHGTCWVMQVAEFAHYTGNREQTDYCRDRIKSVLFPNQLAADGSFPQELRRTKPYNYCLFNLDAMATSCQILSTPEDNLWTYKLPDGRGMEKGMAFMYPFIADKKKWPYSPDVEYFDQFPLRQPSLLFAGLALSRPEYIATWKTLNPDPTVQEAIRNYPIRQPVLWV
jgi:Alginate lyase